MGHAEHIELERDIAEQYATKRFEEWLESDEYQNSVQLQLEALLCNYDILAEAIGADGIPYPQNMLDGVLASARREREIEYEDSVYYPKIALAVMHGDALAIGQLILNQINGYLMGTAKEMVEARYSGKD